MDFEAAIRHQSQSNGTELFKYRFNLGVTLRRLGELERSIDELRSACEVTQNKQAIAYNNLGISLYEAARNEEAIQQFNKAIQVEDAGEGPAKNKNLSHFYNNRGLVQARLQIFDEALRDYARAIERDPCNADCFFNRGNVRL